jgi:MFS superfamily sulfate permease-like transporter
MDPLSFVIGVIVGVVLSAIWVVFGVASRESEAYEQGFEHGLNQQKKRK